MNTQTLSRRLKKDFDGLLHHGEHEPNGVACALEFRNVILAPKEQWREAWNDNPNGFPDIRRLNDGRWEDDATRTKFMLPLLAALWDWKEWSKRRKVGWAKIVALETVRQVLPIALDAAKIDATACRKATTLEEARDAACAYANANADAAYAAAADAAVSAYADADAAYAAAADAAVSTYAADAQEPLILCCKIMINAAKATA